VAGLLSGNLDAAQLPTQYMLDLERQAPGRFHTLIPLTDAFPQIQINGLHVRRDWAVQNPQILKDVLRAILQANRRVIANPQLLYDEAVKRMQMDPAAAKQVGDVYLKANVWDPNGSLTRENVQYTIDFLIGIKSLPAGLKADDVADLSYLNAVLDEIGRR
jgi:ABC-type nitrate/sulfonate/bicarbonate transport system substrate-binding protein